MRIRAVLKARKAPRGVGKAKLHVNYPKSTTKQPSLLDDYYNSTSFIIPNIQMLVNTQPLLAADTFNIALSQPGTYQEALKLADLVKEPIEQPEAKKKEKPTQAILLPIVNLKLPQVRIEQYVSEQTTTTAPKIDCSLTRAKPANDYLPRVYAALNIFSCLYITAAIMATSSKIFLQRQLQQQAMMAYLRGYSSNPRLGLLHKPAINYTPLTLAINNNQDSTPPMTRSSNIKEANTKKPKGPSSSLQNGQAARLKEKLRKSRESRTETPSETYISKFQNLLLIASSAALVGISIYSYPILARTYLTSLVGFYAYERINALRMGTEFEPIIFKIALIGVPALIALSAPATGGLTLPVVMYVLSILMQPDFGSTLNSVASGMNFFQYLYRGQFLNAGRAAINCFTGESPTLSLQQTATFVTGAATCGYFIPQGYTSQYCRNFTEAYLTCVSNRIYNLGSEGLELTILGASYIGSVIFQYIASCVPSKQVSLASM